MKKQIEEAFRVIPVRPDGTPARGAVLVVHDVETNVTRGHLAARLPIGDARQTQWKVAAGGGFDWAGKKPTGWVGIGGSW